MEKVIWSEVPQEQVNPKMKRKFIYGKEIMLSKMEFEDGFEVPWHTHVNEQVTEVIEGTIRFWFDYDEEHFVEVHAGEALVIPSNRPHKALMVGKVIEWDIFAPPRQDWIDGTDDYLKK
jgi:quercetin dioxygenase-like cupin family protein